MEYVIGLVLGALVAWLFLRSQTVGLTAHLASLEKENQELKQREAQKNEEYDAILTQKQALLQEVVKVQTEKKHLEQQQETAQKDQKTIVEMLQTQFESLSHKVLKETGEALTKQQNENMGKTLEPLRERLTTFQKEIADFRDAQNMQQGKLVEQIRFLSEKTNQISHEAEKLTKALKTDTKVQGNWGEIILQRVLERSGLVEGEHYILQGKGMDLKSDTGAVQKPDCIILLPEKKHVVVDSKMSLTAYERLCHAENEEDSAEFLAQHVLSLQKHIEELSAKSYYLNEKLISPEVTLLFVPIENALTYALQGEKGQKLVNMAWDHRIVLVTPSTLFLALRTVESVWKHEKQTKNAQDMARYAGALVDKFAGALESLEDAKKSLKKAENSFDDVVSRLHTGRGNMLSYAHKMVSL